MENFPPKIKTEVYEEELLKQEPVNDGHNNFKSYIPSIKCCEDINNVISDVVMNQNWFHRETTPLEKSNWSDEELKNFKINSKYIDRLYDFHWIKDKYECLSTFHMVARMQYNGRKLYIEVSAKFECICYRCFFRNCPGHGFIFVSNYPNLFINVINRVDLFKFLVKDGIKIEKRTEHEKYSRYAWSEPPTLTMLCHIELYENKKKVQPLIHKLPNILRDSVNKFFIFKNAKESYNLMLFKKFNAI